MYVYGSAKSIFAKRVANKSMPVHFMINAKQHMLAT